MLRLHKHNKEIYERLTQLFASNERVAVVQPTGTGKSFIILKLISDNTDKRFLVLSPSVYIFKQIETHANESKLKLNNVEFLTYMKLANMSEKEINALVCDYIVLDEFHRCGAAEWGRGIVPIRTNYEKTRGHSRKLCSGESVSAFVLTQNRCICGHSLCPLFYYKMWS